MAISVTRISILQATDGCISLAVVLYFMSTYTPKCYLDNLLFTIIEYIPHYCIMK